MALVLAIWIFVNLLDFGEEVAFRSYTQILCFMRLRDKKI